MSRHHPSYRSTGMGAAALTHDLNFVERRKAEVQLRRIHLLGRWVNRGQERFSLSCCDCETHLVCVKALGPWDILYVLIGSAHPPNDLLFGDPSGDFRERRQGEARRIHLLRTRVNTARTRRAQRTDVPHDDLEEAKIRGQKGVYVTMPFQTHQRNVVGGCWERTETRTRTRTGRSGCCLQTTTPCSGRALRGYWPPTGA